MSHPRRRRGISTRCGIFVAEYVMRVTLRRPRRICRRHSCRGIVAVVFHGGSAHGRRIICVGRIHASANRSSAGPVISYVSGGRVVLMVVPMFSRGVARRLGVVRGAVAFPPAAHVGMNRIRAMFGKQIAQGGIGLICKGIGGQTRGGLGGLDIPSRQGIRGWVTSCAPMTALLLSLFHGLH